MGKLIENTIATVIITAVLLLASLAVYIAVASPTKPTYVKNADCPCLDECKCCKCYKWPGIEGVRER